jgi:hypothetical protein
MPLLDAIMGDIGTTVPDTVEALRDQRVRRGPERRGR